jgi:hypothetical protein
VNEIGIIEDPTIHLVVAGAADAEEVRFFSSAAHFSANQMVKREIARRTTEMAWLPKPFALCPAPRSSGAQVSILGDIRAQESSHAVDHRLWNSELRSPPLNGVCVHDYARRNILLK